jgi:HupE / UreJ protein
MLVRDIVKLLATVTAFTMAHTIALVAATLEAIDVPSAPIEATIALSIVFLASAQQREEAERAQNMTQFDPRFHDRFSSRPSPNAPPPSREQAQRSLRLPVPVGNQTRTYR